MIKNLHSLIMASVTMVLSLGNLNGYSQTTLGPGDVAVLGFNSGDAVPNQRWAFITFKTLTPGTKINFTDAGFDLTTNQFRAGALNEGHMTWTTSTTIPAGSIIYGTNTTINSSTGGVTGHLGDGVTYGFSPAGDQIIVYQGTAGTAIGANFVYALNTGQGSLYGTNGNWLPSGSGTLQGDHFSYMPPGLTTTTAFALTSGVGNTPSGTGNLGSPNFGFDNMYYAGPRTGTKAQLLANIANPSNWIGSETVTFNLAPAGVLSAFTILPVSLIAFNLQLSGADQVKIYWTTSNEVNNDHFAVERSFNGIDFSSIANVRANGSVNLSTDYNYIDQSPSMGINYYRLKQFDIDGDYKVFETKSVTVPAFQLTIHPNPASAQISARFANGRYKEVQLLNHIGQVLRMVQIRQNDTEINIPVSSYSGGTYYLKFIGEGTTTVKQFVKTNN